MLIEAVRAAARGEAMVSPQVTVRLLRHFTSRRAWPSLPDAGRNPLSERELATVQAAADGLTNAEVAERLHISLGTVKKHLAGAQLKLDVRNRVELAAWAYRHGHMDGPSQAPVHR
ncbi:response regulator transcription factor [Kitasatospora sp. HPMI-4]|uniref:response regulator transcription factor n=1 Tax=Kitasatospora sp. HPMI-4 TaxID=3448443 RepID=UPI003F1DF91F